MTARTAYIHAIGTAVPRKTLEQTAMRDLVLAKLPESLRGFARAIYDASGIVRRRTVIEDLTARPEPGIPAFIPAKPVESRGPSTAFRNSRAALSVSRLGVEAVDELFRNLKSVKPGSVTHLVTAGCTGFSAPGIDLDILRDVGLSGTVQRYHLGFMGCLAAFPALRLANEIAESDPSARILVVCSEVCSVHYRHLFDRETIVANSLFSDGAAAVMVGLRPGSGAIRLDRFCSDVIPSSSGLMSWSIGDHGFEMGLSSRIPSILGQVVRKLFRRTALKAKPAAWAIHPGGRAIIDRIETALETGPDGLEHSRKILAEYGNMSSPTVLFILEAMLKDKVKGQVFSASFGPGLSAEAALLKFI